MLIDVSLIGSPTSSPRGPGSVVHDYCLLQFNGNVVLWLSSASQTSLTSATNSALYNQFNSEGGELPSSCYVMKAGTVSVDSFVSIHKACCLNARDVHSVDERKQWKQKIKSNKENTSGHSENNSQWISGNINPLKCKFNYICSVLHKLYYYVYCYKHFLEQIF